MIEPNDNVVINIIMWRLYNNCRKKAECVDNYLYLSPKARYLKTWKNNGQYIKKIWLRMK